MTVEEYFGDWVKVINTQQADSILKKVISSKKVCPKPINVFKAFKFCSFNNLKVVIIGDTPYSDCINGEPIATGIAFANNNSRIKYSSSLESLRESVIDYTLPHRSINFDASLEKWEKQGVLLINAALSCEINKREAHLSIWKPFISNFLIKLSEYHTGIVYILIGKHAKELEPYINHKFNYIFCCRSPTLNIGLLNGLWYNVNKILTGLYGYSIKWFQET